MAEKRIYELTAQDQLNSDDYIMVDKSGNTAAKKVPGSIIVDQFSDMQNVYGAKNQLPYPYTHTTKAENGLTFTDLGNGKVTVSGTATAETTFYLDHANAFADKDAGTYILSGCPEGGNRSSGYFLEISGRATASDNWTTIATDIGEGATFTITTEMLSWVSIHVFIRVRSGKAISTPITYAPMIRLASITDDTWVPFAKTNKQLTDDVTGLNSALTNTLYSHTGDNIFSKLTKIGNNVIVIIHSLVIIANNTSLAYHIDLAPTETVTEYFYAWFPTSQVMDDVQVTIGTDKSLTFSSRHRNESFCLLAPIAFLYKTND